VPKLEALIAEKRAPRRQSHSEMLAAMQSLVTKDSR